MDGEVCFLCTKVGTSRNATRRLTMAHGKICAGGCSTRRGSSNDMIALFSAPRASQRCQLAGDRFARGCSGTAVFFPLTRSLVKRLLGQDYTSRTLRCVGKEPRSRLESTVILSNDSQYSGEREIVNGDLQFLRRKSAVRGMVFPARKALSSSNASVAQKCCSSQTFSQRIPRHTFLEQH